MLPTASIATQEPILSPCVLSPWQTSRAPPTRSTSAMCSGERNPSGGESKVVNETTSPPPITEVGVISTGWRGHQREGGVATSRHRGQREAARCSIICSGGREAGLDRGWPEIGAAWLRTPAQPSKWDSRFRSSLRGGSSRFEDGDPVVGARAADRLGQGDAAAYLPCRRSSRQLPDALDDLRDPRRRQWMAAGLEASGRIDRQAALERGLAVERGRPGLAGREEPDVLERDELERGERVVDLGDVHALGAEAGHREGGARSRLGRSEARETLAVPEGQRVGPLPHPGH